MRHTTQLKHALPALLALACGLAAGLGTAPARAEAEASNLEMVAMVGGRIIGAAKAC